MVGVVYGLGLAGGGERGVLKADWRFLEKQSVRVCGPAVERIPLSACYL